MGRLFDGVWQTNSIPENRDGRWERSASLMRNWVVADGTPGITGRGGFRAERGRYHLYVAWNCPWAHRTLLFHQLKKLGDIVSVSYVAPHRTDQGWIFEPDGQYADPLFGSTALHQIYTYSQSSYTGKVTVPVLWDKATNSIVSNESADIIRMFDRAFKDIAPSTQDYYPTELAEEIDAWNQLIHETVNDGVYRAGFATDQAAYEEAVTAVFDTLEVIEDRLGRTRYLLGETLAEADWRLFPTLVRFDVAYYSAFKCNLKRLIDYPNLWGYARELYQMPNIAQTVKFDIYRRGYHSASISRNPYGIVPVGPRINWDEPHNRDRYLGKQPKG